MLQRFAVSREVLQESVEDLFAMAAAEGWSDPVTRKALQFIERRQRNRAAIDKSPYNGLEDAVAAASRGVTREIVGEIGYLSGIKPLTAAKIMGDAGGEALAILCKATGLSRLDLQTLWRAMRRPELTADGEVHPDWERVQITYEMLAVVVGVRQGGAGWKHATADGVPTAEPAEAVRGADIIAILTPDMIQNEVYRDIIEPNAKPGAALLFAHGFSIIY